MLSAKRQANPFHRNHRLRDAGYQALYDAMSEDASVHLFGEGCEVKVHYDAPAIERDFPGRCHTLPIAEDAAVNFGVGAALLGVKPIINLISSDFMFRAADAICNTAAKVDCAPPPGDQPKTIVIQAEFLSGGPTTGQRNEALFTHIPGLNVVIPSTPRDAYGLMRTALNTPGVTLFFEDREIADDGCFLAEDFDVGRGNHHVALGCGAWRDMGPRDSVTVVTYGVMRQRVEQVVEDWQSAHPQQDRARDDPESLDCGIIDLRSIYPIDWELLRKALARTRKLLIVEPDIKYGGVGAEIAAWAAEGEMRDICLGVKRLGGKRETMPAAKRLQGDMMPSDEEIASAIRELRQV